MTMIREAADADWPALWQVLEPVFRAGETYAFDPHMTEDEARRVWMDVPLRTYVAEDENSTVLGTYYLKPNQAGPGAHVCNCGYVVSTAARGQGIAAAMCVHSQEAAVALGFKAMQYNSVVSTNEAAVHLWQKLGFEIVGKLPKAFDHPKHGLVDAYVMYKELAP